MRQESQLTTLATLKILKKLATGLNFDTTAITNKLNIIEEKVNQIPVTDLSGVNTKLITIEGKINQIPTTDLSGINAKLDQILANSQPSAGLKFTELNLNPTYQTGANNGWLVAPQNIEALYDNDTTTASNLFKVGGYAWSYGEIILTPSISIPQRTKIELKVGLRNTNNQRSLFELAVFDIAKGSYVNVWAYAENLSSSSELIANIDSPYFNYWDKLRFRLWDVGQYQAEARFYSLKVWKVE